MKNKKKKRRLEDEEKLKDLIETYGEESMVGQIARQMLNKEE